jgi:Porin PorA
VRRWWPLAGVCLGAFLLTGAAMLRWYAAPLAARVPVDTDLSVTLAGTGTAYDVTSGTTVASGLRETLTVHGDPGSGTQSVAVWSVERRLTRPDGTLLGLDRQRLAVDRRTARAVACCGEQPRHEGLGYAFPAGVPARDVRLFDPDAGRAFPARYAGEDEVGGLRTYRFEQVVPDTDVGTRPVPGAPALPGGVAGLAAGRLGEVTVSARRTVWVEPTSGVPVRVAESRREQVAWPGRGTVVLLDAHLTTDDAGSTRLSSAARARRAALVALRATAPVATAIAGAVLLAVGLGYRIVTAG